ncbi:hypothetical protein TGAM01_v206260 [Trichoderma gamsii]|uniref:F-box domain-containing protein n=1 Tax=Trichoderma gamsii TaxID=398673 RepID=A0A2P4ZKE6_9HYPO|nr:hypothetical protein TGAM01_v206260 [Trichoderma gamsii]PON24752.1 hypothetical protein TGAM01_v206260 [Trichoderma gamsii]
MFHDIHLSHGIPRLLRTLLDRPDLADRVRRFSNDKYTDYPSSQEFIPTLFNNLATRFGLDDVFTEFSDWVIKTRVNAVERELWMLEMAVALLNKVTVLFVTILVSNFEDKFVFGKLFMKSVTMSSVKRLFLSCHGHINCKLDLGCLGNFLGMMPRLERLDVQFCGGATQFLPLYELRSLIFDQSIISVASLKRLVMSCPKLERFEYCGPRAESNIVDVLDFTWEEMQSILALRKNTLKHINAGFHNFMLPYYTVRGEFGSFADFKALEKLLVEVFSLDPIGDFADLLPESLTLLGIRYIQEEWNGVEELANAVRSGRFSHLKKVVLDLGQEEFEVARKQLDTASIACVRYNYRPRHFGNFFHVSSICLVVLFEHLTGNDD